MHINVDLGGTTPSVHPTPSSGGFKGGGKDAGDVRHPWAPKCLYVNAVFGKFLENGILVPHAGWRPLLWEILDPPMPSSTIVLYFIKFLGHILKYMKGLAPRTSGSSCLHSNSRQCCQSESPIISTYGSQSSRTL